MRKTIIFVLLIPIAVSLYSQDKYTLQQYIKDGSKESLLTIIGIDIGLGYDFPESNDFKGYVSASAEPYCRITNRLNVGLRCDASWKREYALYEDRSECGRKI